MKCDHLASKTFLRWCNKQGRQSAARKSPALASGLLVSVVAQVTLLLAVQRFSQVHHSDFSVAVYCRDSREQAGFGKSTKRYSKKLKTPLEG